MKRCLSILRHTSCISGRWRHQQEGYSRRRLRRRPTSRQCPPQRRQRPTRSLRLAVLVVPWAAPPYGRQPSSPRIRVLMLHKGPTAHRDLTSLRDEFLSLRGEGGRPTRQTVLGPSLAASFVLVKGAAQRTGAAWGRPAFRDPGRGCDRPLALSTLHIRGKRCLKIGRYSAVHTRITLADRTRSAVSAGSLSAMLDRKVT
jgi:hypothetical protein